MSSTTEIERTLDTGRAAGGAYEHAGDPESATWSTFVAARSLDQFYASWLSILCAQVEQVIGALLLVRSEHENTYVPGAIWPEVTRDMSYLAPAAQRALTERQGVVDSGEAEGRLGRLIAVSNAPAL